MDDPALPPNLAAEIADLKARVRVLETANPLQASSVRGGTFKVLDDDGIEVARIGRIFTNPAVDGLNVIAPAGTLSHLFVGDNVGIGMPWLDHAWHDPTLSKVITSGTFGETWRCIFELNTAAVLKFRVPVITDAGTTIELRVVGAADVQIGVDKSIPGSTSTTFEFVAEHGVIVQGSPVTFKIQARRTAGAGNGYVYTPTSAAICGVGVVPTAAGWV